MYGRTTSFLAEISKVHGVVLCCGSGRSAINSLVSTVRIEDQEKVKVGVGFFSHPQKKIHEKLVVSKEKKGQQQQQQPNSHSIWNHIQQTHKQTNKQTSKISVSVLFIICRYLLSVHIIQCLYFFVLVSKTYVKQILEE